MLNKIKHNRITSIVASIISVTIFLIAIICHKACSKSTEATPLKYNNAQ